MIPATGTQISDRGPIVNLHFGINDSNNSGFFEKKLDIIKSQFHYSYMEIIKNDEDESELLIHFHGGSLEDFYDLPPQQKIEMSDRIYNKKREFNLFFEEMSLVVYFAPF